MLSRRALSRTVRASDLIYTIVDEQKKEYDRMLNVNSKILTKGGNFEGKPPLYKEITLPLKFVYTGNIYAGRWESLVAIGRALDEINKTSKKGELFIYSKNELTPRMQKCVAEIKSVNFMGSISPKEVHTTQKDADVLVHVEAFNLRDKLSTRLSFSTKLVDYFSMGKCILAVGWGESASIKYLEDNDIAVVVDEYNKLNEVLERLLNQNELVRQYGVRAWEFGKRTIIFLTSNPR